MTEKMNADIKQLKDKWSSEGKRVILLARKVLNADIIMPSASWEKEELMLGELKADLTLVGLLALIDPPRPEIPDVMQTLRGAGIRTFMVCAALSMDVCGRQWTPIVLSKMLTLAFA